MPPEHVSVARRLKQAEILAKQRKNKIKLLMKGLDSNNPGIASTAIKDALKLLLREIS